MLIVMRPSRARTEQARTGGLTTLPGPVVSRNRAALQKPVEETIGLLGRRHGVGSGVARLSGGVTDRSGGIGSGIASGGRGIFNGSGGIASGIGSGIHGRGSRFSSGVHRGFRCSGFLLGAGGQGEGRDDGGESELRLHLCIPQERASEWNQTT
ncbi:MAG: hypothetical protein R3E65_08690 [Steroidobacteraceae bacterium]